MGGSKQSTPSPWETAMANKETAKYSTEMSFVDQYTPDGSFVYSKVQNGDLFNPPRYRLDTALSAQGQAKQQGMDNIQLALLGMGQNQLNKVNQAMGANFNVPSREQATNDAMNYLTQGYEERFNKNQAQLENQLIGQGIRRGSTAWSDAMGEFSQNKDKSYETAGMQAYQQGLGEQQAQIQQQAYLRSLPLNELSALISGTQVGMPQFTPVQTSQVQQMPYFQQQGGGNNWLSDMIGLGGSLGSAAILGKFGK